MKIITYEFPHSSFLSVDKDLSIITTEMLKNNRLKKLLHYATPDALKKPNLSDEESLALLNKQIKIIPKIPIDQDVFSYVIISCDNFVPNANNPEFRDNFISFDIICHLNQWNLQDFQLRPYRIAAEIDTMVNDKKLTGIGTLQFLGAKQVLLTDEFAGISLTYEAIHGGEDTKTSLNPQDWEQYKKDFDKDFNHS